MVQNSLLSQEVVGSPATVTTTGGVGEGTVGAILVEQKEECNVLTNCLKLELGSIHEDSALLPVGMDENKVPGNSLQMKVCEENLNGRALLRRIKRSKQAVE